MKKFITNKYVLFGLGILFLILMWCIVSKIVDFNNMIFPGPKDTFLTMIELLKKPSTYKALGFSLIRLILGFLISAILAFILGMIVHDNKSLYEFMTPTMTFFKSVPTATLIFLFIVLSGVENASMLVVITVTLPILYEAIVGGLKRAGKEMTEPAMMDGASKTKRLFTIQLPIAVPHIIIGVISSFSLAFKIEVMSEVIMGYTEGGLGAMIKNSQIIDPTNLTPMFAYSFMAVIIMLLISLLTNSLKSSIVKKLSIEG